MAAKKIYSSLFHHSIPEKYKRIITGGKGGRGAEAFLEQARHPLGKQEHGWWCTNWTWFWLYFCFLFLFPRKDNSKLTVCPFIQQQQHNPFISSCRVNAFSWGNICAWCYVLLCSSMPHFLWTEAVSWLQIVQSSIFITHFTATQHSPLSGKSYITFIFL